MKNAIAIVFALGVLPLTGCFAPLRSPGIAANTLPDSFRYPEKSLQTDLNLGFLTTSIPEAYTLGKNDVLRIEVSDLSPNSTRMVPSDRFSTLQSSGPYLTPLEVVISERGYVVLPLVGMVELDGLTIEQARERLTAAYADGYIDDPKVGLTLIQEGLTKVMVMGEVARPGVYELPKFNNDIAHAIANSGGLTEDAAAEIQVHRRAGETVNFMESLGDAPTTQLGLDTNITRIPLKSIGTTYLAPEQVTLNDGDVVVIPRRKDEVFFVLGRLSTNNTVRFSLDRNTRDLGNGFILPPDRDVDVITAVAMAGYIDPIESPTTVTVQRIMPNGCPLLVRVDLIKARYSPDENILIKANDIVYLNPDWQWWFRRSFDRIVPDLFTAPYGAAMQRWINPLGFN